MIGINTRTRVSDIISEQDIHSWSQNSNISISSATDTGKSFFIKNKLYDYCNLHNKKMIYIVSRRALKNQFLDEIISDGKDNRITISTYQKLEYKYRQDKLDNYLDEFDYIILDEYHYFLNDSSFNRYTVFSLDAILCANSIRIWISATGEKMRKFLQENRNIVFREYHIEDNPKKMKISVFKNERELDEILDIGITNGFKMILFTTDLHQGVKFYERYRRYAIFNCSESNYTFNKYVNKKEIRYIEKNERFEKNILITSTALDCGLNIRDSEVRDIIIHGIHDIDTIVQCVGRKRFTNDNDSLTIHIPEINNCQIGGYICSTVRNMARADYMMKHGEMQMIQDAFTHPRRYSKCENVVFDSEIENKKIINELSYFYYKELQSEYKEMISKSKNGFRNMIMRKLGITEYEEFDMKEHKALRLYLESLVIDDNIKKFKEKDERIIVGDDQKNAFIERINMIHKDDYFKDIKVINSALSSFKLPYRIESFKTTKRKDGEVKYYRAWRVVRV